MYIYELTQLKSPGFPWQIVAYVFIGGIAAGAFLISALLQAYAGKIAKAGLHRAYYLSFLLIPICGLLLIGKLEIKSRFINVLWQGRDGVLMLNTNSPMSVGAWILPIFALFTTIGALYALGKDGKFQSGFLHKLSSLAKTLHEGAIAKVYLTIGSIFAAWFSVYIGILVITTHVPAWNATPLIPVLWITSAVVTGVSAVILILLYSKRSNEFTEYVEGLNRIVTSVLVINLAMVVIFVASLGPWKVAVTGGTFGILLWGGTVVLGLLIPLLIKLKPNMLGLRTSLLASSFLILIGGLILRYVVIMGPQSFW